MINLPIKILQTIQIETATDTVTFTDIDDLVAQWDARQHVTSRHLVVIINARSVDPANYITNLLRFNGDAGNNYNYQRLSGIGAVASAGRTEGANAINLPPIPGQGFADLFGGSIVLVPHALNTTNQKAVLALGGAGAEVVEVVAGRWASIAAITSVTVFEGVGDDFVAGSCFHLGVIDERYLVEEVILTGLGTITFDNIPQGEGDLAIIAYCRGSRAAVADNLNIWINDDSNAVSYFEQVLTGIGAVAATSSGNDWIIGRIVANGAAANTFGPCVMTVSQFAKGNQPHIITFQGYHESSVPEGRVSLNSLRRNNLEPVNKIELRGQATPDFMAGSLFSLYRVPKRLIERVELAANQATVTFNNIPQNFAALILHIYARSDLAAASWDRCEIDLNNDAVDANYGRQFVSGAAAAVTALGIPDRTGIYIPTNGRGVGQYSGGSMLIPQYAENDKHKHRIHLSGENGNIVVMESSRWLNTNAVTRIDISPRDGNNFMAGSIFELEGVLRKEGLPPSEGEQWGM